jgi:hypothetical protein
MSSKTEYESYLTGVGEERERIIKLLESQIHGCSGYDCDSCDDSSQIVELIELIKGETNG